VPMDIKEQFQVISEKLSNELKSKSCHLEQLQDEMNYSLMPFGKLIRPLMIYNVYLDLYGKPENIDRLYKLMAFVETHHAYTLVHDDLPCMDNDDMRRGKPSVHKKYGEWRAVLTGDALLLKSINFLSQAKLFHQESVFEFVHWCLGAKGLISGQVMDLGDKLNSLEDILRMFELKTARLFQVCLITPLFLEKNPCFKLAKDMFRLGSAWGILFQCLDDKSEIINGRNDSEKEKNIFLINQEYAEETLHNQTKIINNIISKYSMNNTKHLFEYMNSKFN
jgi:geranylgeranyl pyrophosphate synthase